MSNKHIILALYFVALSAGIWYLFGDAVKMKDSVTHTRYSQVVGVWRDGHRYSIDVQRGDEIYHLGFHHQAAFKIIADVSDGDPMWAESIVKGVGRDEITIHVRSIHDISNERAVK
jgi:hypothetical protein